MGKLGVCLTAGPLLIILGSWPLMFAYAYASMVPPQLEGWSFWSEVLGRMFRFPDPGWFTAPALVVCLLGSGLFLCGLALLIKRVVAAVGQG